MLKAMRYGTQSGRTNRSDKNLRRISSSFTTTSLLSANLCPTCQSAAGLSWVICLMVLVLTGINPPFQTMTIRFNARPRPNNQNPGSLRLNQAKVNKINRLVTSPAGAIQSGRLFQLVNPCRAMNCTAKATGTNHIQFKLGICNLHFRHPARTSPTKSPVRTARRRIKDCLEPWE